MVSKSGFYKHRIIPGHMGGTYDPSNVVLLTIKQHALAHKKLFKQHGKYEDWLAWKALSGQISKQKLSTELEQLRRFKIGKAHKGHETSEETRRKISAANTGKPKSLEARAKMSAARMGKSPWNKGKNFSTESKQKMSLAKLGKPWSVARRQAYEASKSV